MLNYLLLLFTCLVLFAATLCQKQYSARHNTVYLFTSILGAVAAAVFACTITVWDFSPRLFLYAGFFALPYIVCVICELQALRHGPLALVSLVINFSLLLPTFYGIFFLKEPVTPALVVGIVLVCATIYLVGRPENVGEKVTPLWIVFVAFAFVGNGMCSITQRFGQEQTGNISMVMFLALAMISAFNLILSLLLEKPADRRDSIRHSWYYAAGMGLFNGLTNYLVTVLNPRMSASIMFPVIGALSLFLTFVVSLIFYKEKYSRWQLAGFGLSLISVVILNL